MRVLYISYWGALEQLGQSLVVPAVVKLSKLGATITLVTFEKPSDLANKPEVTRVNDQLEAAGIEWIALKYHKDPKIPATAFDVLQGILTGLRKRLSGRYDIVHARTYIGGFIGLTLAPLLRAKFVFHNEGFYPDEQVDGGFWGLNSRPHRVTKWFENKMYARADGIIALSYRAKAIIDKMPPVRSKQTPVIVVQSCVDLDRFHLPESSSTRNGDRYDFVYIGSVGGRYILDRIGAFVAAVRKAGYDLKLQIFSKADKDLVRDMMNAGGADKDSWALESVAYVDMPEKLASFQAGMFFLSEGISEHGCSPTKIGEYWAVGVPVISTPNVSDTDEIIGRERTGVIVKEHSESGYVEAFERMTELLKESGLDKRCRAAAEKNYALAPACERQFELYRKIIG